MKFKSIYCLILFSFLISVCKGQQDFSIKKEVLLSEFSSLSHIKDVLNIIKDKRGFLWLATTNGLYKFNGYETKHYEYDPAKPQKIAGNWIIGLTEDDKGNIWFGVFGIGLQKLDPITEKFTLFTADANDPNKLSDNKIQKFFHHKGNLWIDTQSGGLNYSISKNIFKKAPKAFNSFTVDDKENFWALSWGAVNKYDVLGDSFKVQLRFIPNTFPTFFSNLIMCGESLYYISREGNFIAYNTLNNNFTIYNATKTSQFICLGMTPNQKILVLRSDKFEEFDPQTKAFQLLTDDKRIKDEWASDNFSKIIPLSPHKFLITGQKCLLLNYGQSPIEKYELLKKGEKFLILRNSLLALPNNNLSLGTLASLDLDKEKISYLPNLKKFDKAVNFGESYTQQFMDKEGILWVVMFDRENNWTTTLHKYNIKNGILEQIGKIDSAMSKTGTVMDILKEGDNLWLATWLSLVKFNTITKQFSYFEAKKDSTGLSADGLRCTFLDSTGDLWIGTQNGLNYRKKGTNHFVHYLPKLNDKNSLSFGSVSNIHEDKKGIIWIGTFGGLNAFDKKTGKFKWYTKQDGLADNNIIGVQITDDQTIWISHNKGISHLNPTTGKIINYNGNDGVLENSKIENAICTLQDGSLIFGGYGEFNRIYPKLLLPDSSRIPFYITDIKLNNKVIEVNEPNSILQKHISFTKALTFKHNENVITLQYAALDFTESEHRQYAYMLEGFDSDWQYVGSKREVTFTNLSSGTYKFRVKSGNRYGIWHEIEQPLNITILPPWWQTWWAYLLYAVAFIFALSKYIQYRSKKLIQEKTDLEEKVSQRTTDLEKSLTQLKTTQTQLIQSEKLASLGELTAGIAHEIQNPLNFVNNFSELSVDLVKDLKEEMTKPTIDKDYIEELFTDLSQNQEKINHHGKRASSIVKGMLEHSRASTGVKELTDINKLADEYLRLSYHGLRAKDKNFNANMETNFDENLPKIAVIPQDLGRVLLNLFNNAFYAVNEKNKQNIERNEIPKPFGTEGVPYKPTVTISTQNIDNQIVIKVKDNGIGMSEATKAKVFQPFFTTKPTGQGTGLGLSLAYDIVTKGHGGKLEVESNEGVGVAFIITLPFKATN
jgi:signal transduction histidine kinase